jgi:hypothetical protein
LLTAALALALAPHRQYPLYGGIMGIMTATGLAGVIAQWFIRVATPHTLPLWGFISSIIISLFVPSGGGHWAVQGPFMVPAAASLHVSQAAAAMAVGSGEGVANMIQPFWALPLLAIAGIGMGRVMGLRGGWWSEQGSLRQGQGLCPWAPPYLSVPPHDPPRLHRHRQRPGRAAGGYSGRQAGA